MSAFSRGCSIRHQLLHTTRTSPFFLPRQSLQQPRFLSSTRILRAVTKVAPKTPLKQALPKNKPSFTPTKSPTTAPQAVYQTFASRLAQKKDPTLLYLAPSHTAFVVASYIGASFCFSYAVISFWSNYLNAPPDIQAWVPIALGGVSFFMAVGGSLLLLGPAWIVKSITAMPPAALKAARVAVPNLAKGATPELTIEIEFKKMFPIPFVPARKMYVKPEDIRVEHKLATSDAQLTGVEKRAQRLQEEEAKRMELEYKRTNILSRGIRHMNKASFNLFLAARRTWTREGFTKFYIKNYRYKLDVSGGWALDGGRALDRLVTIKPL